MQNNAVDIFLSTCGIQNCLPGHFFGPGQRELYIIHFICGGKGRFVAGNRTYDLTSVDFFVIFPCTEVFYQADSENPWDYLSVDFQGVKAATYPKQAGIDPEHLTGHFYDASFILTCIQQMILARSLTYHNELKRQAALLQILATLIEIHHKTLSTEEQNDYPYRIYLQQAIDYMNEHIKENIKISEVAAHIGIDRSYLSGIFKSTLEISPQEYLMTLRMDRAADLLKNTHEKSALLPLMSVMTIRSHLQKCLRNIKVCLPPTGDENKSPCLRVSQTGAFYCCYTLFLVLHIPENFFSCFHCGIRGKTMPVIWIYNQVSMLVSSYCPVYICPGHDRILGSIQNQNIF